jgi:aspartate aminotransferase
MKSLATRISVMNGEGALSVFARANELERSGRSIVHLELGEPGFHPAEPVRTAAKRAIDAGLDRYVSPQGIPELRLALVEYLARTRSLHTAPENVFVAPGCKIALALAMQALIEPGDEVIYPDPGFPIYPSVTRSLGAVPIAYRMLATGSAQPDPDEVAALVTPRTKLLILNAPNNPTGTLISLETLAALHEIAVRHDLWVISDEIYSRLIYDGVYHSIFMFPGAPERTIILDGFSKTFAMSGWRLGYAIAPPNAIAALNMLTVNSFTCVAQFTQIAAVEALRDSTNAVTAMLSEYARRRQILVAGLNRIPGLACPWPQGAFFAWVDVSGCGMTGDEFSQRLLEEAGVAGIAGSAFGAHGRDFVRFSFAQESEHLQAAVQRIEQFVEAATSLSTANSKR